MSAYHPSRQLWLLFFLTFIGTVGIALPYPIFAPLILHPGPASIIPLAWPSGSRAIIFGFLLAVYPLGMFLGSPVLGGLSDYYGRRKLIIGSLAAAVIGYLVTATAIHFGNLYFLIFGRFFTGFVEGNIAIIRSNVADMKDINKHRGFGIVNAGTTVGYLVGPLIGGTLSDSRFIGWFSFSTPFYFSALIVLLAVIFAWFFLFEPPKSEVGADAIIAKTLKQRFNIKAQLQELCQSRPLKLILIAGFCFFLSVDTYYEFYPAFLVQHWQMNALSIAILTAILSAGITVGGVWLSRVYANHFKIMPAIFWHALIYALMILFIMLIAVLPLLYAVFVVIGIIIGVISNYIYVHISKVASDTEQGKALGMATGLRMLGDAIISVVGGLLIIVSTRLPLVLAIIAAFVTASVVFRNFVFNSSVKK